MENWINGTAFLMENEEKWCENINIFEKEKKINIYLHL